MLYRFLIQVPHWPMACVWMRSWVLTSLDALPGLDPSPALTDGARSWVLTSLDALPVLDPNPALTDGARSWVLTSLDALPVLDPSPALTDGVCVNEELSANLSGCSTCSWSKPRTDRWREELSANLSGCSTGSWSKSCTDRWRVCEWGVEY